MPVWETIHPRVIGVVRNGITQLRDDWDGVISEIIVEEGLAEALDGIEGFSHILVLFWMDRVGEEQRAIKKLHPRGRKDLPLTGVFATRTQYRPNPIGATVVRLLGRRDNLLRVQGLDALDGTPVLDIKAYMPTLDPSQEITVSPWVRELG